MARNTPRKDKIIKFRIDNATYRFLYEVSQELGITLSELVRNIIFEKIIETAMNKKSKRKS